MELKLKNCYYCEQDFYTNKDDDKTRDPDEE